MGSALSAFSRLAQAEVGRALAIARPIAIVPPGLSEFQKTLAAAMATQQVFAKAVRAMTFSDMREALGSSVLAAARGLRVTPPALDVLNREARLSVASLPEPDRPAVEPLLSQIETSSESAERGPLSDSLVLQQLQALTAVIALTVLCMINSEKLDSLFAASADQIYQAFDSLWQFGSTVLARLLQ